MGHREDPVCYAIALWDYMWNPRQISKYGDIYVDWKQVVPFKTVDQMTVADWDEYVPKLRRAVRSAQITVRNEEVIKAMLQHIMKWIGNKRNTKMAAWARDKR